jgi:capsule polysaccharide export protein KpsC/LpsZ
MDMMKSELNQHTMSKGLSDAGLEYDPNHPSIIEELLQQEHEWTNIQDVIKLSFKAVHQVLYHHVALFNEI